MLITNNLGEKKIKVRLSSRLKNWGNDGDNDANSVNNLFEVGRVANSKLESGMWNGKEGGGGAWKATFVVESW